jgi:hypothetical protein
MRASSKVAFKPLGARVLKSALSHLQLTPSQVAELDRWLKVHNGLICHPRHLMRANRDRLRTYLTFWSSRFGNELLALTTTSVGMGYSSDGWEEMTVQGFFLACHVVSGSQPSSSSPPTLQLL